MAQDDPFEMGTTPRRRRPAKGGNRKWLWLGSAAVSAVVAITVIAVRLNSGNTPPLQSPTPTAESPSEPGRPAPGTPGAPASPEAAPPAPNAAPTNQEELVDDPNGQLLWTAPTHGPAISLAYVPAGTQCLIHLCPADVAAHPEGERVLASLGPWGQTVVDALQRIVGSNFAEMKSLLIAVTVGEANQLEATLRVEFVELLDDAELAKRFPTAQRTEQGGVAVYELDGRSYFLMTEPTPALVIAPTELATELINTAGDPPPLVRDVETLVEQSDAERDATFIVAPKFLQASGNDLLTADAAPLHDALRWLLGEEATAVALSVDWGDDFFVELRAMPTLNVPPRRLAAKLRQRISEMPAAIEETVLAESWHPYGRKIIARLPGMLRTLARYTRASEAGREAIVRVYLPATAGHNLLMASELLLTQPHDDAGNVATGGATPPPARPVTVAEKLAAKTSLSFTKESLEQAVALLAADTGLEITIAGGDLQLDGITKNQSLGLDLRDRPASEILLEILLRANPDRQATGPADSRQKLVYVIEPTTTGAAERIIVTTRTAAEKRSDRLPAAFLPQAR